MRGNCHNNAMKVELNIHTLRIAFMATNNLSPIRFVNVLLFSKASKDSESDWGNLWSFKPMSEGSVSVYDI